MNRPSDRHQDETRLRSASVCSQPHEQEHVDSFIDPTSSTKGYGSHHCQAKKQNAELSYGHNKASPVVQVVPEDHPVRQQVRQDILEKLVVKQPHIKDHATLATAVERLLFKMSGQSIDDHLHQVDKRLFCVLAKLRQKQSLQPVASTCGKRKRCQSDVSQIHSKEEWLSSILSSKDTRDEIMYLLDQVRQSRLDWVSRSCGSGACQHRQAGSACSKPPSSALPENMPECVRNLFFRTRLVCACRYMTEPSDCGWEELMEEARSHLREFEEWKMRQQTVSHSCDDTSEFTAQCSV